jgi:hypothetical protein
MIFSPCAFAEQGFYFDEYGALQRSCESLYREIGVSGKSLNVEKVFPEMKTGRFPLSQIPNYQKEGLYLGVARNADSEGTHHYYVMVDGMRFEGIPLYGKPKVKKTALATNGVLFEVPVPPGVAKALGEKIRGGGGPRDVSCLHAMCRLLASEGVVIEGVGGPKTIRASIVVPSLVQGKLQVQGRALDPATLRWIATGENEATEFLKNAMDADESMKEKIMAQVTAGAVLSVIATGTGSAIFFLSKPEKQKK